MDSRADHLIQRQEAMASARGLHEQHWQEIAELINPMRAEFNVQVPAGAKRMSKIFDGTAGLAQENLTAGLYGMMTNPANEWFRLASAIPELNEVHEVRLWLDEVSRIMRDAFAARGNRFYTRIIDLFADVVSFGTGAFYAAETTGTTALQFSCRHLTECYIAQNEQEDVDTLFRRFKYTARQAVAKWGAKAHRAIAEAAQKHPEQEFEFLHAVLPRREAPTPGSSPGAGPGGERVFWSAYVDVEHRELLSEGGYYEFPYQVPRWSTRSRSVYGDSPAMLALPDTKMLNQMSKTTIVAAQKVVDPPILAYDEAAIRGARLTPGQTVYGGVDQFGRQLVHPLQTNANVGLGLEMEEQRRQAVREAFYWSLLLMIQQPNMTATEFLGRQEEQIRLMGPHLGRIQTECLDPLIDRVFALLLRAGAFPPPPQILMHYPNLRVVYTSPAARAQKAGEAAALIRTGEAITPMASLKPEIWDNFDEDQWARAVAEGLGTPARIMRDPREVARMRALRQQTVVAQGLADRAKPVAGALKDIAGAGKTMAEAGVPVRGAA